jgi:uncharacterized GH25 family protein
VTPRLIAVFVLLLAFAPSAGAHDLRALGSKLTAKPGDESTIYITWGHALPVDDVVDAKEIEHYGLKTPSGSHQPLKAKEASLQANVVKLEEEGVYQALVIRRAEVSTKVIDEEGRHRHVDGPKSSVKRGKVLSSKRDQQFAKALVVVGKVVKSPDPAGLPFEIVPLDKPVDWRAGSKLRFQVLFNEKPAPNVVVRGARVGQTSVKERAPANDDGDPNWTLTGTTDRRGIVELEPKDPGAWILQAERQTEAEPVKRSEYDRESYTTSLTLEIRP